MSEPDGKPPEPKLSPWKQFLEDVSWDIFFFRAITNLLLGLFFEEGKAVKSGWFAFFVFTTIAFWGGCHYENHNIDSKLSGITNYFGDELSKRDEKISDLKGQLTDAKADRDKYQIMLAPFQAAALKIYTNEPLEKRLDLLAGELSDMSKTANIDLVINDITNLTPIDIGIYQPSSKINTVILTNREIRMYVLNKSKFSAINSFATVLIPFDQTNLIMEGWFPQPKVNTMSNWRYNVNLSIPSRTYWDLSTIQIRTNISLSDFDAQIKVGADNAETKEYYIRFILN